MADLTEEQVWAFINKVNAADTDKKVDVVQAFGFQLEDTNVIPPSTLDTLTLLIPQFLNSHSHLLYTAALISVVPFYLPLIPHSPPEKWRVAVSFIGPCLFEKMIDAKERIHGPAQDCLVVMGKQTFSSEAMAISVEDSENHSGKSKLKESAQDIFERFLKDALQAKSPRSKLGSMKVLREVRKTCTGMALRPYLPLVVALLEDSDGSVREAAKETIISLLSPSSVPAAARSELRKLLLARNLKTTSIDAIMNAIHSGGSDNNDSVVALNDVESKPTGGGGIGRMPVAKSMSAIGSLGRVAGGAALAGGSGGDAAVEVKPIYIHTEKELEGEFHRLITPFEGKETEHNWAAREKSVGELRGLLAGGVYVKFPQTFIAGLKAGFLKESVKALLSLRTTVAVLTAELYIDLMQSLRTAFDPLIEIILPHLAKMSGMTKKIVAEKSQAVITVMINQTGCPPKIFVPQLAIALSDKIVQSRQYFVGHLKLYLDIHAKSSRSAIENAPNVGIALIVDLIRKGVTDPNSGVKDGARQAFWSFCAEWPNEASRLLDELDDQARKAIERAGLSFTAVAPALRSVSSSANLGEGPSHQVVKKKPSGPSNGLQAAIRKARAEAAAKRDAASSEASSSKVTVTPGEPVKTIEIPPFVSTPTRVPLPLSPSSPFPPSSPLLRTPLRQDLPPTHGLLLDLIDTPIKAPIMMTDLQSSTSSSVLPLDLLQEESASARIRDWQKPMTPRRPGVPEPFVVEVVGNGGSGQGRRRVVPAKTLEDVLAATRRKGPPVGFFSMLRTRCDCSFWLDRREDFAVEGTKLTDEEEATFRKEFIETTSLSEDQLDRLDDLVSSTEDVATFSEFSDSEGIVNAVRDVRLQQVGLYGDSGKSESRWGGVIEKLVTWLETKPEKELAEHGLFLLWDLAIRHSPSVLIDERNLVKSCLVLAVLGDHTIKQATISLLALICETSPVPIKTLNIIHSLLEQYRNESDDNEDWDQIKRDKFVVLYLECMMGLCLRIGRGEMEEVARSLAGTIVKNLSPPSSISIRQAIYMLLTAMNKVYQDSTRLLNEFIPELGDEQKDLACKMFEESE